MRRSAATLALSIALASAAAWAQPVRVDSTPARATLVCDGRVVGLTPTAFDPATVRSCTLFAAGHENLALDVNDLHGAVARYALHPVAATASTPAVRPTPCGRVDPRTGLLVPCFTSAPAAPVRRVARRCGRIDPGTGLLIPCFGGEATALTARPSGRGAPCGRVGANGLLVPCFPVSARPAPRR